MPVKHVVQLVHTVVSVGRVKVVLECIPIIVIVILRQDEHYCVGVSSNKVE